MYVYEPVEKGKADRVRLSSLASSWSFRSVRPITTGDVDEFSPSLTSWCVVTIDTESGNTDIINVTFNDKSADKPNVQIVGDALDKEVHNIGHRGFRHWHPLPRFAFRETVK